MKPKDVEKVILAALALLALVWLGGYAARLSVRIAAVEAATATTHAPPPPPLGNH